MTIIYVRWGGLGAERRPLAPMSKNSGKVKN